MMFRLPISRTTCEFIKDYLNAADVEDNTFLDPNGTPYSVIITENVSDGISKLTTTSSGAVNGDRQSNLNVDITNDEIAINTSTSNQDSYVMWIIPGGTCAEDAVVSSAKNDFAVLMRMEGSGVKCTGSGH